MKKSFFYLLVLGIITVSILSCERAIEMPSSSGTDSGPATGIIAGKEKKKVYVSNISELYAAVNDAGNAGMDVILAPGAYVLSASYPNGGRLELQSDMSLIGLPGRSDDVLIDQSSLPNSTFRITSTISTGGIRVGRGTNTIEWLTIKGGAAAAVPFSVIETDLIGAETYLKVAHVNIDCNGSRFGIMLRNRLEEHAGRIVNTALEHSSIWGATNAPGFGIAIQNRISGAQINLDMKENYIHGNRIGILGFNGGLGNSIANCKIQITSHRDRLEGNGCAIDPSGATNGSANVTSNNNSLTFRMYGGTITDNNPPGHPELLPLNGALPGGVYVAGGYNSFNNVAAYNTMSGNKVVMEFFGCNISNNNAPDFYAYGLYSATGAVLAGTNNAVDIFLHGLSANATVTGYDSNPIDPAGSNLVNVYRN